MRLRLRRSLFLVHRWLGVAMCAWFALWFATGIIMMYVEYPELTEEERLATAPAIDFGTVAVPVEQAVAASQLRGGAAAVVLAAIGARPAYRVQGESGESAVVYADDGSVFTGHSAASAVATVERSGFASADSAPTYDGAIDVDQWTVSTVLDEHRPLHRVLVGDGRGTVVYLSDTTGQIVRDTHRAERAWNWLGSTIHWIYPFQLRRHGELWTNLLIYLSVAGIVSVATGAAIGFMRLRPLRRYRGRDVSPYAGAARWHHVLGLCSLVFLSTFIFSGLMSMSPWGLFDSASSEAEQIRRYARGSSDPPRRFAELAWKTVARPGAVKEVEWRRIAGVVHVVISRAADDREVVIDGAHGAAARERLQERIAAAAPALVPGAAVVDAALVEGYDDYYYSRHNRYRPLPAYRVTFDDPESTWFYIDATTGAVVLRYTTAARAQRWLYNGLHSLDFSFLIRRGALWDATMIVLCALGFLFTTTAVIVGWRRVQRATRLTPQSR
jgi:hypothetical protein